MTARLLMIALDGADGRLTDRGSTDGSLPNLAALRARGRAQPLSAPPGSTDDAVWASFQYGAPLGEHGRYNFYFPLEDGRMARAHWQETDRATFWDALSDAGQRVAILDAPKCRKPRPLNGIHLADWLVHGRYFPKPRSHPTTLAAEVLERFGPAPPSRCNKAQDALADADVEAIRAALKAGVAQKRAAGLHYLAAEPWDLFLIGFKEAHCASHAFWDFDPAHPAHDAARRARLGDPITDILENLDAAVGALVAAAGPEAATVVFSTSDYAPNACLDHLMPALLDRLNDGLAPGADGHCQRLPYNENCAALRVAGADPARLAAIEARLRGLRDADTGEAVVAAISRPSTEQPGSRAHLLPDLLVHWAPGAMPRAVVSAELGRIEGEPPLVRTGNHVAGGLMIAAGDPAAGASEAVRTMADLGPLAGAVLGAGLRPAGSRPGRPGVSARS